MSTDTEGKTFSIVTFGCKLNQYESECIRQSLEGMHWTYKRFEDGADYFIINSCTVTGKSDSRCRNAVRRARRMLPEAKIIVTGCYAQTQPQRLEAMEEVDMVIGNGEKQSIPQILSGMQGIGVGEPKAAHYIDQFLGHSRAFIKVQEGCNAACTYCIIPSARGASRSVPPDEIMGQVERLVGNGYREIVLTGIHIGRYGRDIGLKMDLARLIEMLLDQTEGIRIRLSSIEINEVSDALLELISSNERVAPHLHIPLQSGDDSLLAAMNRPYGSDYFRRRIGEISEVREAMAIGTDVIVGFPGETEENFGNTQRLLREMPFTYLHVFGFSKRPGTPAADMPHQVHPEVRKRRSRKLIALGKRKRIDFMKSRIGQTELSLVQGSAHRFSRFSIALSGTYCEVLIKRETDISGSLLPVRITHYSRGRLYGVVSAAG
jgi:threonylcarbamoyladenosine tRNA methylthiotransferase MtaB